VDLDHHPSASGGDGGPAVLVLHGLEGSSRSGYVEATCREMHARGLRSVVLNFRGCSGEPNRTPRFYHSGETGDLAHVLEHLRSRGVDPLGAVGYSLGGNVLLKHLAEAGPGDAVPDAAVAVSVPFDLASSADKMARGAGRFYSSFFLRSLREKIRIKAGRFPDAYDLRGAMEASTLREFDDAVTAPIHGFRDADDYYRRASSGPRVPEIRVPTLLIHALDDPFVPASAVPDPDHLPPEAPVDATYPGRGGHVGFMRRNGRRLSSWVEVRAADYLAPRLS
jgi:predicted alpha/beta-fold hydrolase